MRRWQSGQLQETVNLPDLSYAGSNPARRTRTKECDATALHFYCFVVDGRI